MALTIYEVIKAVAPNDPKALIRFRGWGTHGFLTMVSNVGRENHYSDRAVREAFALESANRLSIPAKVIKPAMESEAEALQLLAKLDQLKDAIKRVHSKSRS